MNSNRNSSSGIGICGVLTIVFVVLKLVGVINWSWLWVLCPLWINALFGLVVIIIIAIVSSNSGNKSSKSGRIKW